MNDLIHFVGYCDLYFPVPLVVSLLCNCVWQAPVRRAPLSSDDSCLKHCTGKLKVNVILEDQAIKWSLASVNVVNSNFVSIIIKKKSLLSKHDDIWLLSSK